MHVRPWFVVMLIATGALPVGAALKSPVRVESGSLTGVPGANPAVTVSYGVPYAAPPVGPLR